MKQPITEEARKAEREALNKKLLAVRQQVRTMLETMAGQTVRFSENHFGSAYEIKMPGEKYAASIPIQVNLAMHRSAGFGGGSWPTGLIHVAVSQNYRRVKHAQRKDWSHADLLQFAGLAWHIFTEDRETKAQETRDEAARKLYGPMAAALRAEFEDLPAVAIDATPKGIVVAATFTSESEARKAISYIVLGCER